MQIREVSEGDEVIPGVGIVDMPGHSPGSIGITVETAEGLSVITGDAIHFASVVKTKINPLVFWNAEQATRSIERVVEMADILYPGHDQPFRVMADGEIEFTMKKDITLIGLTPDTPGVSFSDGSGRVPWVMPGIEEQLPVFEAFAKEAHAREHDALEAGVEPDRPGAGGRPGAPSHDHPH